MKQNKISTTVLLLGLGAIVAVSCQKAPFGQEQKEGGSALAFSPMVSSLVSEATKGALINDNEDEGEAIPFDTKKEFKVIAWDITGSPKAFIPTFESVKYFETELAPGVYRNMWNTTGSDGKITERPWKKDETKLFYAYSNLPESGSDVEATSEGMVLTHRVPATAGAQTDILLGSYKGDGTTASGGSAKWNGTATIHFKHPLTSVILTMGEVKGTKSFTIRSVALEGVYAGGSVSMNDAGAISAWVIDEVESKPEFMTVSQDVATTPASKSGAMIGEPFIVIPQQFVSDGSARIKVSVTADGRDLDLYYPLLKDDKWQAGHVVTYDITYNGHEGVQLWKDGPYWATANVGAENPEDCGWFFTWGNVKGYVPTGMTAGSTSCTWKTPNGEETLSGGFTNLNYYGTPGAGYDRSLLDTDHDAAYQIMGEKWRMPTQEEFALLKTNTVMTPDIRNGQKGYRFTGTGAYSNRSIFLPSAGFGDAAKYSDEGVVGIYWSSTLSVAGAEGKAWRFRWKTDVDSPDCSVDMRYYGRTIRAVENVPYIEETSVSGN